MVGSEVLSNLIRQLLEQTFQFVFVLFREEHATVRGREVLDNGIMGVGRQNPNGLGAVDLIEVSTILILSWMIISSDSWCKGTSGTNRSRKEAAAPCEYQGSSSQTHPRTQCTVRGDVWPESC